jgi:hypothetical protein
MLLGLDFSKDTVCILRLFNQPQNNNVQETNNHRIEMLSHLLVLLSSKAHHGAVLSKKDSYTDDPQRSGAKLAQNHTQIEKSGNQILEKPQFTERSPESVCWEAYILK